MNVVTRAGRWMESLAAETAAQRDRDAVPPVSLESIDEVMSEVQVEEDEVAEVARDVVEVDDSLGSAEAEVQCSFGSPSLVDDPDVEKLKVEMVADDSLGHCRDLADTKKMGYSWGGGLLYHTIVDGDSEKKRLVLPKSRRAKVLELAHDRTGHVGIKKMRALINSRFVWPGIGKDVTNFVQSCDMCARMNKSGNRQAQLVERPIVTEPFESVAVDIVGPLPKAKGGVRFVLTFICMATRWPEAVAMRTGSASEVADGLVAIFTRTSFPLKILSDRGSVFMGRVVKRLYEILGIDSLHTSPYRPQGNGVVERFQGTLKPMLAKAVYSGVDWATFLPMALFAMRQVVNRDTGFSPHELVFGKQMRGPLDILYAGWVEDCYKDMDVSSWVERLQDRLKVLHEVAVVNSNKSSVTRMLACNKNKSDRVLDVDSKVLLRVPGLLGALEASWEGPYEVVDKLSRVNYKVRREGGQCDKIVHINNTKRFVSRPLNVNSVCVVAEEDKEMCETWEKRGGLSDEVCDEYSERDLQTVLASCLTFSLINRVCAQLGSA